MLSHVFALSINDNILNDTLNVIVIYIMLAGGAACQLDTNLWLHIHQTGLLLIQNSVNGFQTGAIQIIFIFPIFNKSAQNTAPSWIRN